LPTFGAWRRRGLDGLDELDHRLDHQPYHQLDHQIDPRLDRNLDPLDCRTTGLVPRLKTSC
jgi:hypothetical protein